MARPPTSSRTRAAGSARRSLVALLAGVLTACSAAPARPPGDVVVILIDTLRPDHLGFYGYPRETAPFLASLAREGTVFERAHSTSSWTAPATASLFTSLYPTRHGVTEGFFAHRGRMRQLSEGGQPVLPLNRLPMSVETLAERFQRAGYRTFGAAANVNIGHHIGFDRGFDRFLYAHKKSAGSLVKQIAGWSDELLGSDAPTFLYLHLNDVHSPYEKRKPWYQRQGDSLEDAKAAYDSQISYLDDRLAKLARKLEWGPSTLFAVVSDHGEEFEEHGGLRHDGGLHQELTRVLMLFRGPGVPATRVRTDVSLVDVLPTLAELAGLPDEPADAPARDGESLVPLMTRAASGAGPGESASPLDDRALLAHRAMKGESFGRAWWAVIRDGWKLMVDPDGTRLYDHDRDFGEQQDLAPAEPERARELAAELDALRRADAVGNGSVSSVPLDEELLRALEELGYVEDTPAP